MHYVAKDNAWLQCDTNMAALLIIASQSLVLSPTVPYGTAEP